MGGGGRGRGLLGEERKISVGTRFYIEVDRKKEAQIKKRFCIKGAEAS